MRKDTLEFLKLCRPQLLKKPKEEPKQPRQPRTKDIPPEIMNEMITMRQKNMSFWNITVWLHKEHGIHLVLQTVTKKIKHALASNPRAIMKEEKMKKCDCGNILTEIEIAASEQTAKDSKTQLVYMCRDCWDKYIEHAITGN